MKLTAEKDDLKEAIKGADLAAQRKAFRKHLPYAILRNGNVILVYPDNHTEIATPERLEKLHFTKV
jgi:hypothetical protein